MRFFSSTVFSLSLIYSSTSYQSTLHAKKTATTKASTAKPSAPAEDTFSSIPFDSKEHKSPFDQLLTHINNDKKMVCIFYTIDGKKICIMSGNLNPDASNDPYHAELYRRYGIDKIVNKYPLSPYIDIYIPDSEIVALKKDPKKTLVVAAYLQLIEAAKTRTPIQTEHHGWWTCNKHSCSPLDQNTINDSLAS